MSEDESQWRSSADSADEWKIELSIPADGYECFYVLRNGVQVAEIDGYQTELRKRHLNDLVEAANASGHLPQVAPVQSCSADSAPLPDQAWREWLALSASEKACYHWPDDTDLHRQCRAAYIAGATDYGTQPQEVRADSAILNEIGEALECRGYVHMTNGRDIGQLLDELERLRRGEPQGASQYSAGSEGEPFMMLSCREAKQCLHNVPGCICDGDPTNG